MDKETLKQIIADCCNEIVFTYQGNSAGVTLEVRCHIPTFQAWYGKNVKYYTNVDDVMTDPFYDGKSLTDLVDVVEINIL